jgi:class 3 adenylate cyclase
MSPKEMVALIVGIISIGGALVTFTRYVTNLQAQLKVKDLEKEMAKAESDRGDLVAANKALREELAAARNSGAAVAAKKGEVDSELEGLARLTGASAGSVYLPLTPEHSDKPMGLVFLSVLPLNAETVKLRKKIIPLKSLAGKCLTTGTPSVAGNAKSATDHFDRADAVSGYHTQDILTYPLRQEGRTVGVLQLMNRTGGDRFSDSDLATMSRLASSLTRKVAEFRDTPGSIEMLGVTQETENTTATMMFCDLTSSSTLFEELSVPAAIQHLNEYFEKTCEVVFRYGGTIDKYSGDGALFRFNVPHVVEDHPAVSLRCAMEIQDAFAGLKREWLTMGDNLSSVHSRIGLAYGPVQQALVGHPQYQYLTIFGTPVNAAVNLCDSAPRDRSVIVIDEGLYDCVRSSRRVQQLPREHIGKAQRYTSSAYEVVA